MAALANLSTKRNLIDKANTRIVIAVGVAAFILIFSLVATKTLVGQAAYQNRIISAKRTAVNQLKSDITASGQLKTAYAAFTGTSQNVLGGNPSAFGPNDGNSAKIVLDALPSTYDFPGLTTTLETLLNGQNVQIKTIAGTDDEVAQSANQSSVSPQPLPIPFSVSTQSDYAGVQKVVAALEHSIRPIQVQTLDISGATGNLTLEIHAQTYFQPAKSLNINKKVIK